MNKGNIDLLVDVLQNADAARFNIVTYFGFGDLHEEPHSDKLPVSAGSVMMMPSVFGVDAHQCGTSACALGFAMLDQRFQALGFRRSENSMSPEFMVYDDMTPKKLFGIDAAMACFDLSNRITEALFYPGDARTLPDEYENDYDTDNDGYGIKLDMVIAALQRLSANGEDGFLD